MLLRLHFLLFKLIALIDRRQAHIAIAIIIGFLVLVERLLINLEPAIEHND